jgi:hypothetical protein
VTGKSREKNGAMTGEQYSEAIEALGLNQITAAKFLDVVRRTSNGYANGQRIPRAVQLLLQLMIKHKIKPAQLTKGLSANDRN